MIVTFTIRAEFEDSTPAEYLEQILGAAAVQVYEAEVWAEEGGDWTGNGRIEISPEIIGEQYDIEGEVIGSPIPTVPRVYPHAALSEYTV